MLKYLVTRVKKRKFKGMVIPFKKAFSKSLTLTLKCITILQNMKDDIKFFLNCELNLNPHFIHN